MLSQSRKPERKKIAKRIEEICNEFGAQFSMEEGGYYDENEYRMRATTARGLSVQITIRRKTGKGINKESFVLPWCVWGSDAYLKSDFPLGSVSPNGNKATVVVQNSDELFDHLAKVFARANDGSLFDNEKEAQSIAENGTFQESADRFQKYIDGLEKNKNA